LKHRRGDFQIVVLLPEPAEEVCHEDLGALRRREFGGPVREQRIR
jgi:hypothetical protein